MLSAEDRERLVAAVDRAVHWHARQARKGTGVPYVSHLLQVAGLVLEHGGDGDQAVAALLHDALEDTDATVEDVEHEFGPRVARIVLDATDTLPGDAPDRKSPWEERKRRHLDRFAALPADSALVVACDKRHNLASIVADVRASGLEATAARFNSEPDQWLWYYRAALNLLGDRIPVRLATELEELVAELDTLLDEDWPA